MLRPRYPQGTNPSVSGHTWGSGGTEIPACHHHGARALLVAMHLHGLVAVSFLSLASCSALVGSRSLLPGLLPGRESCACLPSCLPSLPHPVRRPLAVSDLTLSRLEMGVTRQKKATTTKNIFMILLELINLYYIQVKYEHYV